jgi:hypothetical protein
MALPGKADLSKNLQAAAEFFRQEAVALDLNERQRDQDPTPKYIRARG